MNSAARPWFATSVDQLVLYEEVADSSDSDDEAYLRSPLCAVKIGVVEAKARTNEDTEEQERELISKKLVKRFEQLNLREQDIATASSNFRRLIPNKNYRQQVIHHLAVADTTVVFFAVADRHGTIMRVVAIQCDYTLVVKYRKVMDCIYRTHLHVYYEATEDELIDYLNGLERKHEEQFGYAADALSVLQKLKLTRALEEHLRGRNLPKGEAPRKELHLLPKVVAEWNRKKNSIDVVSRLVRHAEPAVNTGDPGLRMFVRILLCSAVNLHRVFQIEDILPKMEAGKIKTITALNNARSEKRSMRSTVDSLIDAMDRFINQTAAKNEPMLTPTLKPLERKRSKRGLFTLAQKQGSPVFQRRLDKSHDHDVVTMAKKGTCKVCCSVCVGSKEKGAKKQHSREGFLVSTGCKDCEVHLCAKQIRFPEEAGLEHKPCHEIWHTTDSFPSYCDDLESLHPRSTTTNQLETGRKSEESGDQNDAKESNAQDLPAPPPVNTSTPRKPATKRRSAVVEEVMGAKRRDNVKNTPPLSRRRGST